MCEPISIGIATAVVGGIGAIANYQAQQQQVEYNNAQARAQADYQNRLSQFQAAQQASQYNQQVNYANQQALLQSFNQRAAVSNQNLQTQMEFLSMQQQRQYQTLQNQLQYQTELNKSIVSQEYVKTQLQLNRDATSRAFMAEQQKLRDAEAQAALEGQKLLTTNLQTQGTILASGRTGQSIGLLANDASRVYGQNAAILGRNVDTAYGDYMNNAGMAVLRQLSADAEATSRLIPEPIKPIPLPEIPRPVFAELPEYGPLQKPMDLPSVPTVSPVLASGPSSIGLIGGIGSSVLGGVNAGLTSAAAIKQLK